MDGIKISKDILAILSILLIGSGVHCSFLELKMVEPCYNIGDNISIHGNYSGDLLVTVRLTIGENVKSFDANSGVSAYTSLKSCLTNATFNPMQPTSFTVVIPEVTECLFNESMPLTLNVIDKLGLHNTASVTLMRCTSQSPVGVGGLYIAWIVLGVVFIAVVVVAIICICHKCCKNCVSLCKIKSKQYNGIPRNDENMVQL